MDIMPPSSEPHYSDSTITLHHGDCLDVLRSLPDASVDAVCTDPPYGLANTDPAHVAETIARWVNGERDYLPGGSGFMGKAWDAFVPPVAVWDDCLRVLKPGGHVLAFAGSRTVDLMTLGLRLAGFDIRDSVAWLYGSGFPKSLDVSKAIDKAQRGAMVRAKLLHFAAERGVDGAWLETHGVASGSSFADWTVGGHVPSDKNWALVKAALDVTPGEEAAFERAVIGAGTAGLGKGSDGAAHEGGYGTAYDITAPATPDAERWQGWGTALKPAFEPVVVARKPLAGTVAANVLAHGTGALNVDGCRVDSGSRPLVVSDRRVGNEVYGDGLQGSRSDGATSLGRWPANVVLDESQAAALDEQSGELTSGGGDRGVTSRDGLMGPDSDRGRTTRYERDADQGGASRFFYVAKADTSERVRVNGVAHPTVKPLSLMRWLVRLVTPPGGTVLEPFAGSGTTVEACILEGFRCVAIEREADYLPLIVQRINRRRDPVEAVKAAGEDAGLFDLLGGGAA